MNADFSLETGSSHHICEDYGRANNSVPGYPFVIICDGCSDPRSPDVDFGARILAKTVEDFILQIHKRLLGVDLSDLLIQPDYALDIKLAIAQASAYAICLGLHPQSLDCTLMVARIISIEQLKVVQVDCWGDGSIIAIRKNGIIEAYEITYPSGCPFYPKYY